MAASGADGSSTRPGEQAALDASPGGGPAVDPLPGGRPGFDPLPGGGPGLDPLPGGEDAGSTTEVGSSVPWDEVWLPPWVTADAEPAVAMAGLDSAPPAPVDAAPVDAAPVDAAPVDAAVAAAGVDGSGCDAADRPVPAFGAPRCTGWPEPEPDAGADAVRPVRGVPAVPVPPHGSAGAYEPGLGTPSGRATRSPLLLVLGLVLLVAVVAASFLATRPRTPAPAADVHGIATSARSPATGSAGPRAAARTSAAPGGPAASTMPVAAVSAGTQVDTPRTPRPAVLPPTTPVGLTPTALTPARVPAPVTPAPIIVALATPAPVTPAPVPQPSAHVVQAAAVRPALAAGVTGSALATRSGSDSGRAPAGPTSPGAHPGAPGSGRPADAAAGPGPASRSTGDSTAGDRASATGGRTPVGVSTTILDPTGGAASTTAAAPTTSPTTTSPTTASPTTASPTPASAPTTSAPAPSGASTPTDSSLPTDGPTPTGAPAPVAGSGTTSPPPAGDGSGGQFPPAAPAP